MSEDECKFVNLVSLFCVEKAGNEFGLNAEFKLNEYKSGEGVRSNGRIYVVEEK